MFAYVVLKEYHSPTCRVFDLLAEQIMCRLQMFEQAFEVLEVMEQSGCM